MAETDLIIRPVTADLAKLNKVQIRYLKEREFKHDMIDALQYGAGWTKDMAVIAFSNPIVTAVVMLLFIQFAYNRGWFNPGNPLHPEHPPMWDEGSKIATTLGAFVLNIEVIKAFASAITPLVGGLLSGVGGIIGAGKK